MSGVDIPPNIRAILSMGPKYMLPSYTLLSNEDEARGWNELQNILGNAGYVNVQFNPEKEWLKEEYESFSRDQCVLSRRDRVILAEVSKIDTFFKTHPEIQLVEGDKGKMVGVMQKDEFLGLCEGFVKEGVVEGIS